MDNLFKHTKRVWTAVLAGALILTSVPYDIFAETNNEGNADESIIVENLISSDDSLSSEPSSEEYEEPAEDKLQDDMGIVYVTWPTTEGISFSDVKNARQKAGKWEVIQVWDDTESEYVNKSSISFKLSAPEHYNVTNVKATVGGIEVNVPDPVDGVYTVKKDNAGSPIDGDIVITADKTPITHTVEVTVTENANGKATFEPGTGMTLIEGETAKYTVSEADENGYSFTVTVVGDNVPIVTVDNGDPEDNPRPEEGVYSYNVSAPTGDQAITIDVGEEKFHTVTVTDKTNGKATFEPGTGMTPINDQAGKYTVSEVWGYSFSVTPATHYTPVVEVTEKNESEFINKSFDESVKDGVYTYTVENPEEEEKISIEVTDAAHILDVFEHATLYVTTKNDPSDSDFAELDETNNRYYEGAVVYYKVEANEGYRLRAVKIGDVTQEKVKENNKEKKYYKLTFGDSDVTVTADVKKQIDVDFTLTGVGTLYYKTSVDGDLGKGTAKALTITNGKGSIPVDEGEKLVITKVTAASGYNVRTDYAGVFVRKGQSTEISYDKEKNYWPLEPDAVTESTEVTVEVKKQQCDITVNNADKRLKSVKYTELYKDSENNWVPKTKKDDNGNDVPITIELSFTEDGKATFSIDKDNKVKFSDVKYADGDNHTLLKTVKAAGKVVSAVSVKVSENPDKFADEYTTDALTGTTTAVDFVTTSITVDKIKRATNADIDSFEIAESGIDTAGTKKYIKRDSAIEIKFTPKPGKIVKSVTYVIGSGNTRYTAIKMKDDNKFSIPAENVNAGILAGSITLTAVTGAKSVTVTVTKVKNNPELQYCEYSVSRDKDGKITSYKKAWTEESKPISFEGSETTASIEVQNGNVFTLNVTPEQGNIVVSDSVKFDGVEKTALENDKQDGPKKGWYLIEPVEPIKGATGKNKLEIATYEPVKVLTVEASGKNRPNDPIIDLTSTKVDNDCVIKDPEEGDATKGCAIKFEYKINPDKFGDGAEFYVTLETPEAYYTTGSGSKVYLSVEQDEDDKTKYTISESEVVKAIKAGADITIEAKATPIQILTATLNSSVENLTRFTIKLYKDSNKTGGPIIDPDVNHSCGDPFEFQKGNYIEIGNLAGNDDQGNNKSVLDDDTDFVRFTKEIGGNSSTYYGKGSCSFDSDNAIALGTVNDSFTLTVESAKLRAENITVEGHPVDSIDPSSFTVDKSIIDEYLDNDQDHPHVKNLDLPVLLSVAPGPDEKEMNFKIDTNGAEYSLAGGSGEGSVAVGVSGGKYYCILPFDDVLAKAAFAGGIKLNVGILEDGYQKQNIVLRGDYEHTIYKATVDGETVEYSGGWKIPYGKDVDITLTPEKGYRIKEVRYAPAMIIDSLGDDDTIAAWLKTRNNNYVTTETPDEEGKVAFTFTMSNVVEPFYVYVYAEETTDYTLAFGESDVLDNKEPLEKKVNYNENYGIVVKKGATPVEIGSSEAWIIEAKTVEPTQDVTNGVLTESGDHKKITFNGTAVQGKTVMVSIKSLAKKEGSTTEPKYSWTLKLIVNKEIKPEDIRFVDNSTTFQLGQKDGTIKLKIGSNFDTGRIQIIADDGLKNEKGKDPHYSVDFDNEALHVTTTIKDKDIINQEKTFKIVDNNAPDNPISTCKVTITTNAVTGITKTDLDNISATATNDMISLNFEDIPFGYPDLDKLHYLVNVSTEADPTELEKEVKNLLIPATTSKYDVKLAKNDDSYEANSYTYNVNVRLVQTKPKDEETYDPNTDNAAISTATGSTTVTTEPSGTFATKLTFVKNKDKDYARIFTTMKDVVLGTVTFPDVAPKVPVTVKRLKKVEITDKAGNVLFYTEDGKDVVKIENYDTVIFNPSKASAFASILNFNPPSSDYKVVAYAVEPKGVDVSVSVPLKIEQGIQSLSLSVPGSIYKASGKAASAKAAVSYYPVKASVKKVEWSLTEDKDGKTPFVKDGVTIKNGTISIKNNVTIPEGGLNFYVCAKAADYATHDWKCTKHVVVLSSSAAPAYIAIGSTMIQDGGKYYSSKIPSNNNYLIAYDSNMNMIDATFTVSGLSVVKNEFNEIYCVNADKINPKVTVTATAKDGSKLSKKVTFAVISDEDLKYNINDGNGEEIQQKFKDGAYVYENNFTHSMTLYVKGKNGGMIDHSIKTDAGVKKVRTQNYCGGTLYIFSPVKNKAVITLVDKATKKETKINIINNKIASTNTAAPRITAENWYDTGYDAKKNTVTQKNNGGNIFNYMSYGNMEAYKDAGSFNKVTYTVKNGKDIQTGKVLISAYDDNLINIFNNTNALKEVGYGEYTTTLDKNGQFTVDYIGADGKLDLAAGNYSFTVTPINTKGEATAKPATFKFKAAAAPKAKVTASTAVDYFKNYKKFGDFKVQNIVFNEGDGVNGSAAFTGELRGINTKGAINKFATTFVTTGEKAYADGWLTCIAEIDEKDYDGGLVQKGMSGWVEYKWTNLDGTTGTAFVKVNPKPLDKDHPFQKYVKE